MARDVVSACRREAYREEILAVNSASWRCASFHLTTNYQVKMSESGDALGMLALVDTLEKLEVLRVLHEPGSPRDADAIARTTGLARASVDEALSEMRAAGIVLAEDGGFRLDPETPHTAGLAALVQLYEDDRVRVLNILTKRSLERIRANAARAFADAFLLKPKKGDRDG